MESSDLLRALHELNAVAWSSTLIPKLKANGSAGNFALACKQLRQLCHGTQTKLRLAGSDCSNKAIAKISQHFPSCTEVLCTVDEDASIHLPSAVPALARLRLTKLDLHLKDSDASDPLRIASMLGTVRMVLPGLRCLELSVATSWASNMVAWLVLGGATQLTSLAVTFGEDVDSAVSLGHLSALSSLSTLSRLTVDAIDMCTAQQYSWLQHMTSLTHLFVPLVELHPGLASIGSCTNLKDLEFQVFGNPAFSEAECAAVAQLVQLTSFNAETGDAGSNPNFLSALGTLRQLKYLCIDGLTPASLPCVAGLSKLTELQGTWQAGGGSSSSSSSSAPVVCNNISAIHGAGPIPFASFPLLKVCYQWTGWDPANLKALAANCKQLECFGVGQGYFGPSMSSAFPARERTAAIQALASLQHLTQLTLGASDDSELAAVSAIKQLMSLYLVVPDSSSCTAAGLQLVMLLRGVQHLTLELHGLSLSVQEAQSVMYGMQQLKSLRVLASAGQTRLFKAALEAAQAAELVIKAEVTFGALP